MIPCGGLPPYPTWATVGGLDPPAPGFAQQTPCQLNYGGHDEVHGTVSSSLANSGDRVVFPIHLPKIGTPGVPTLFDDLFVGTVVTGDNISIGNQSYAELLFRPVAELSGIVNYTPVIAVWSVHSFGTAGSCGTGLNFTWAGNYSCELDEDGADGFTLARDVSGGDFVNVTFLGTPKGSTGLTIYLNDSTHNFKENQVLSAASTGTKTFSPAWSSACPDACKLNWSFPFGLGFGYDLCDSPPTCTSFNNTTMVGSLPAVFLAPHFWNGSAYAGDYRYFAPQSDSGACSGAAGTIKCTLDMQIGTYPYWTFNGSAMNFGPIWPWTRVSWGGASQELDALGTANDSTAFFLQDVTNNSYAGYLAPGQSLTVTANAEDFGNVTTVLLNYTAPGGSLTSVAMTRVSGTVSDGVYNYTIAAPASNGKLTYRVYAENLAGAQLTSPAVQHAPAEVTIGPIPKFNLWLNTTFSSCGGILLNGTVWPDLSNLSLRPGTYPVVGVGCYRYVFGGWERTGGAAIWPDAASSTLVLSASGSLLLLDQYVRPIDQLAVAMSPACGTITVNGTTYSGPTSFSVLDNESYSLSYSGCGGLSFAGWTVDNSAIEINGSSVFVLGNGTITSNWIPSSGATTLLIYASPSQAGGILFRGAGYLNNTQLNVTAGQPYPLHQEPFRGWGFRNWSATAGVIIGGGQITLNSPGSVTANYYRLTIVHIDVSPPAGGHLLFDSSSYFNGAAVNVTNNSIHSIFARANPGYVFLSFGGAPIGNLTVQGNTLVVNGSGTLTVNLEKGTGTAFVGFQTDPSGCGTVEFNGANYSNSQYAEVVPNIAVSIAPWPCNGYGFVKWLTSGGIVINGSTATVSPVGGSIKAEFHALAGVHVFTAPVGCGTVFVAGLPYTNGAIVNLPIFAWSLLSERPCSEFHFTGWVNSTGSTVNATSIYIVGPTLLTANFARNTYAVTVLVLPASCGSLRVGGNSVFNNTTLVLGAGSYPLRTSPCPTNELLGFNATGNVSVVNSTLVVSGAGSVSVNYGPVPPHITIVVPSSAYTQDSVLLSVVVAVPVAPYTYTYDWGFGDGGGASTQANFTNHIYSTTGSYVVTVKVIDPYGRSVQAQGNISINTAPPASNTLPLAGFVVIGILAVLIVTALALAVRRRKAPPRGDRDAPAPPPNVQEPPTLPPGAAEPLSISSGKENDAANESN
jgi:hypothetical protein